MSGSLAPNDHGFRKSSGKTPPPAPSSGFAKRMADSHPTRYRPPPMRPGGNSPPNGLMDQGQAGDGVELPPTNYGPGFKRARAGTLPSNVQLAAQRYASTLGGSSHGAPGQQDMHIPQPSQTNLGPISNSSAHTLNSGNLGPPGASAARPNLRHASTAAPALSGERSATSRLRSGSLTLPPASGGPISAQNNNNAFGSTLFASSWLNPHGAYSSLDEHRSMNSNDSLTGDDVHTLDYLGLDDRARAPQPATVTELRSQAQAAIAGRLRATTVSNPYRSRNLQPLAAPHTQDDLEELDEYDSPGGYRPRVESFNGGSGGGYYSSEQASFIARGFKQSQHLGVSVRTRATSVGALEDPSRLRQSPVYGDLSSGMQLNQPSSNAVNAIMRGLLDNKGQIQGGRLTQQLQPGRYNAGDMSPGSRVAAGNAGFLQAPQGQPRAVSPKGETPQIQTPSRSLWIGNLDTSVTKETLLTIFSPYGAIESLRLLPEKECGFVNFLDINDAVRAKDDVLNRLGGNIGLQNGQPVRIGFGKADSAPAQPAKANGPVNINSNIMASTAGAPVGMEVQSTPTRALWIGSIPSTTTPATILSIFAPFGPIESARVLTHKNCGFINFERLDDAVRARKALNGRDVLGSDVGAIRIGYARVPVKSGTGDGSGNGDDGPVVGVQGIGDLTVGATIHALRSVKGATTIPADQQVLGGAVENYRSNLLLSMIGSGNHNISDGQARPPGWTPSVTEQQMIMKELSHGGADAEADIQALADFRPPTMYYTSIPPSFDRPNTNRRWDAAKLRELRKRLDASSVNQQEMEEIARDMMEGEIVELASDWLGNTVVQKLFEKCSVSCRVAMLEYIAPHLASIGIHKNGTWAAQKIIECIATSEEVSLIAQNLRPYAPPLLLDQFGNYVVQCCLRFGSPANDFIFDAMIDRLWEVAQGRFGARSMRACLESPHITVSQQRRVATAIILNSIPLATNPNGALLLTWLLDASGFPSRFKLLAPRFTPHLSHLCTHKLASLTVLRIVNQRVEPEASSSIVRTLFNSTGDHVLSDVLGDQVNGVAVVQKILASSFIEPQERAGFVEATKRVLIEIKASPTQAYRKLMEDVGIPIPNVPQHYSPASMGNGPAGRSHSGNGTPYGGPVNLHYTGEKEATGLTPMMGSINLAPGAGYQGVPSPMQGYQNLGAQGYGGAAGPGGMQGRGPGGRSVASPGTFSPSSDPFNPFSLQSPEGANGRNGAMRRQTPTTPQMNSQSMGMNFGNGHNPQGVQGGAAGAGVGVGGLQQYGMSNPQYQQYVYQMYPNQGGNFGQ
ncbi:hypothetical protein M408DRAFT_326956 [Serendipita vermifera MAFF 305830]|uniref:PUM-HD domain-containing protein n=1 Tax=Serendipita vermifera MAFF 305830 TaxID=933852 RepID=A0A0C3BLL4_SERVB|nr:hypothetical protein M408DRAFT_326956 [Serendipita vermifera MAFF 305830]